MNLNEKKAYVEQNLKFLPESEKKAFDFNFLCVLTKNSVGMESGITTQLEDVVAVVAIPGVGTTLFETQPLSWSQWLIAIGGAFLIVPMVELQKFIERKLEKRK